VPFADRAIEQLHRRVQLRRHGVHAVERNDRPLLGRRQLRAGEAVHVAAGV
jgi:hypothetical protein